MGLEKEFPAMAETWSQKPRRSLPGQPCLQLWFLSCLISTVLMKTLISGFWFTANHANLWLQRSSHNYQQYRSNPQSCSWMAHFKFTKQISHSPHSKDTVTWICLETWNRKLGSFPCFMTNIVGVLTLKWKVLCWSDFNPEPWSQSTVSNAQHNSQRKSPSGKILGLKRFKCVRLEPAHGHK